MYRLEGVEPGIYFFSHNEYQAVFIEPGDSIMLRVNTVEFDESLSYTGTGADRNNFMMDLFLLNEKENESMPEMYLLSPADFETRLDSLMSYRNMLYTNFKENRRVSKQFEEVAKASLNFDIYSKKELYLSANARKKVYNEDLNIPEHFFNHRKQIDMGNENLRSYYPYYRFLSFYLDNLAFEKYKDSSPYDRNSYEHNYHKIHLIDSLITNDSLKNRLLRSAATRYFLHAKNEKDERKLLDRFLALNTSIVDHKEVAYLAEATINLTPGHTIPNIKLLTAENTVKDLHSAINRPSVIYFWSSKSIKHYKNIHTRASELKSKYPEYSFIGINLDDHFKKWLKVVKNSGYDANSEYQMENFEDAEMKLVIDSMNKAMIVDADGIILNGNTNLFDISIEGELLGFLNK